MNKLCVFLFGALLALAVACGNAALLTKVSLAPSLISPRPGAPNRATYIAYSLARPANVSVYLQDANGKYVLRENQPRAAGDFEILFGGSVDNRTLNDGTYQVVVTAQDANGARDEKTAALTIVNADTTLPELQAFTVFPQEFTPNQDGLDDRVIIRYYLTKPARVNVYLTDGKKKFPIDEKKETTLLTEDKLSAVGPHEYDYDAGIDRGAPPPPDGHYTIVAEAVDANGNLVRQEAPLTIKDGGTPRAAIIGSAGDFNPRVIPLGETLYFTVTVKNVGAVPIRTKGPQPGFVYTTSQNYSVVEQFEEPGIWRLGVDSEGNSIGRQYPFRWQLGMDDELTKVEREGKTIYYLMPGQVVTVSGGIKITDKPPKVDPFYWFGLVQEQVRIVEDHVEPTRITVDF
ncbi:MAG: hypothetical protein BroJett039_05290 [Chloroflexota bacterium]|nr:MAG: hypothetical protein BroJett039_05290 [Chloroflexota bacterium]